MLIKNIIREKLLVILKLKVQITFKGINYPSKTNSSAIDEFLLFF